MILLCGAVFVTVGVGSNGLVVGLGDQDIHEVFIHAAAGSAAFDGDLLAPVGSSHPSLVFWAIALAREAFSAATVSLVGAVGLLFATGVTAGVLARSMAPSRPIAWLLAAACAAPAQLVLGGAPTVDPLLLPRLAALPLELLAVSLVLQRRWSFALGLTSLALAVHAPSASALLVAVLISYGAAGPRRAAPLLAAALGVLPALWMLGGGSVGPVRLSEEVWPLLEARLAHHLMPAAWSLRQWAAAGAWVAVALTVTARLRGRVQVRALLLGLVGWALIAGTFGPLLRVKLLLNLEPWQGARVITLVAIIAAACVATRVHRRSRFVSMLALFVVCLSLSPPRWNVGPADRGVSALAAWAQAHTATGDLFMVPPDLPPGFRVGAQRPIYGQWKDGGEVQFDPVLGLKWASRMSALCGCDPFVDLPAEHSPFSRSRQIRGAVGAAYDIRPTVDLLALARSADASWLVRRGGEGRPEGSAVVGPYLVIPVPRSLRVLSPGTGPAN